jgi:hypothetical protein
VSPLPPVVTGFSETEQGERVLVADLKPGIDRLLGRAAGGRGGQGALFSTRSAPELRPGDAGFADVTARLVAMPLDRFARDGQLLEVRVPWLDVTVWFVPEERDAAGLGRQGISRGRVWTARELSTLMALQDRTPSVVQNLAHAKCVVDGNIVEARRR